MKSKILKSIPVVIAVITFAWYQGWLNPSVKTFNNGISLNKESEGYSISCHQRMGGLNVRNLSSIVEVAINIDSIIVSKRYGTVFKGYDTKTNQYKWFYINISSSPEISNHYLDFEDALLQLGESYRDSIMTAEELWTSIY